MNIKAIIVDDEERGISALQKLIENYCKEVKVEATASDITDAEMKIRAINPDIVFLDIEMPGGSGFELLEKFDEINFNIVFVTAYQEHAIRAIRFSALDYLLKPVKIDDLRQAVERVKMKHAEKNNEKYRFLKNTLSQANPFNRIILTTMEGYYPVKIEEIIYCKADDSYTHFYLPDGKHHIVSKQLKEYEDLLEHHNFFRIHKSFLINLNHIEKILKTDGTSVVMSNKDELPVSLRKKDEFIFKLRS